MLIKKLYVFLISILLVACASDIRQDAANGKTQFKVQHALLNPSNGGRLIDEYALQTGDIILSATDGTKSVGIRLATLSQVSHAALVIQGKRIVDAVGEGVRVNSLADFLSEERFVVVFRHPNITTEKALAVENFALEQVGKSYNYSGIMLQAPFALERKVCELPGTPELVRDFCIRSIAQIQLGWMSNDRFFCSQLVLDAYQKAGIALTSADPRLVSPGDLLHMREGDVPSVKTEQKLIYIGHLKVPSEKFDVANDKND